MRGTDARWRAAIARLLCVALSLTSFTSLVHARIDRDPDCLGPVVLAHQGPAHMSGPQAPDPDSGPVHCVACHLSQSFRAPLETAPIAPPPAASGPRLLADSSHHTWIFPVSQPPLRSPPAA